MTRVLVVNHDLDAGDIEADALRRAGYEVDQCEGPSWGGACPVMNGTRCWQVERADVLIYDEWTLPDGRHDLIDDLRELHPDKPIVLGPHGVTRLGAPARPSLVSAIEAALRQSESDSPAEVPAARREVPQQQLTHTPHW